MSNRPYQVAMWTDLYDPTRSYRAPWYLRYPVHGPLSHKYCTSIFFYLSANSCFTASFYWSIQASLLQNRHWWADKQEQNRQFHSNIFLMAFTPTLWFILIRSSSAHCWQRFPPTGGVVALLPQHIGFCSCIYSHDTIHTVYHVDLTEIHSKSRWWGWDMKPNNHGFRSGSHLLGAPSSSLRLWLMDGEFRQAWCIPHFTWSYDFRFANCCWARINSSRQWWWVGVAVLLSLSWHPFLPVSKIMSCSFRKLSAPLLSNRSPKGFGFPPPNEQLAGGPRWAPGYQYGTLALQAWKTVARLTLRTTHTWIMCQLLLKTRLLIWTRSEKQTRLLSKLWGLLTLLNCFRFTW